MRDKVRIPVFIEEFLFNVYEEFTVLEDKVDLGWISNTWEPEVWETYVGPRYDKIAHYELHRLVKFGTCPFCKLKMVKLKEDDVRANVYVCFECFYWGGRGTRGMYEGPQNARGNLGRLKIVENPDEVTEDMLIRHLSSNFNDIVNLTPKKAEQIVPIVLKDYLDCEVKAIGGVKDGGIDALAIRSDNTKMIIQIKWREKTKGAEGIAVVKEVGSTLLMHGIPNGLIVSTKSRFSKEAIEGAEVINSRYIKDIGRLNISFADFNNLVDMFNIANKKRVDIRKPEEIIPYFDAYTLFG